jgi:hypothetical protein
MRCRTLWPLALLACVPALGAADDKDKAGDQPPTPAAQFKALADQFQAAQRAFSKAYQQAKTDAERKKVFGEKYPKPQDYAGRFLELAKKHPADPAAIDALAWIATNVRSGKENDEALEVLFRDHVQSEKIGAVCSMLVYSQAPGVEDKLRAVVEKNPHHATQGQACYALASYLHRRGKSAESEKLFEQVAEKYADVKHWRGSLADAAKGDLFEIRQLAIGKEAPDIEGEDIDGQKFKLSDYRGKVVVLDFWGHW